MKNIEDYRNKLIFSLVGNDNSIVGIDILNKSIHKIIIKNIFDYCKTEFDKTNILEKIKDIEEKEKSAKKELPQAAVQLNEKQDRFRPSKRRSKMQTKLLKQSATTTTAVPTAPPPLPPAQVVKETPQAVKETSSEVKETPQAVKETSSEIPKLKKKKRRIKRVPNKSQSPYTGGKYVLKRVN